LSGTCPSIQDESAAQTGGRGCQRRHSPPHQGRWESMRPLFAVSITSSDISASSRRCFDYSSGFRRRLLAMTVGDRGADRLHTESAGPPRRFSEKTPQSFAEARSRSIRTAFAGIRERVPRYMETPPIFNADRSSRSDDVGIYQIERHFDVFVPPDLKERLQRFRRSSSVSQNRIEGPGAATTRPSGRSVASSTTSLSSLHASLSVMNHWSNQRPATRCPK